MRLKRLLVFIVFFFALSVVWFHQQTYSNTIGLSDGIRLSLKDNRSHGIPFRSIPSDMNLHTVQLSENPDIGKRAEFQQKRIRDMCRNHFFIREKRLPVDADQKLYFRHLMFDDQRKVIFCFVPKIGCTNMKRLMLYMGGNLPMDTIDWPWVEDKVYLEPALARVSFLNKTLTTSEKMYRIKTYYKFMVVRNPLERLLSGYRNKIESPVVYNSQEKFPDHLKVSILQRFRSAGLHKWQQTFREKPYNISVTFTEFVQHIIEEDVMKVNDHFRPSMDTCHPCIVQFDFYANFRNFSSDVAQLIEKFQTEKRFYRDESLHGNREQTRDKLQEYYSRLSDRHKFQLLGKMYDELLFYYTLYPSERHTHYELLGIKQPIL